MPHTFEMQIWVRMNYDNYVDSLEDGQDPSGTIILSVKKGLCSLNKNIRL